MRKDEFIQKMDLKKGALSKQLGIPIARNIPLSLLNAIIQGSVGDTIVNPTPLGKRKIKITKKLEQRAIFARTLKKISKKNIKNKLNTALKKAAKRNRIIREQVRRKQVEEAKAQKLLKKAKEDLEKTKLKLKD